MPDPLLTADTEFSEFKLTHYRKSRQHDKSANDTIALPAAWGTKMHNHTPMPQPGNVPLLAMLGKLTIIWAVFIEVCMLLGHSLSGGKWPHPVKYLVVAAVAMIAAIYKSKLHKNYAHYDLRQAHLSKRQIITIVGCMILWGALFGCVMGGPPGEPFDPA